MKKNYWAVILVVIMWSSFSYFLAEQRYQSKVNELIQSKKNLAEFKASHISEDISSRLGDLYGVPEFLSKTHRVTNSLSIDLKQTSNLAPLEKQKVLLKNATLLDLDQFLELAEKDFHLNQIFVLNAEGDCIASSLWESSVSCIGFNFSERVFSKKIEKALMHHNMLWERLPIMEAFSFQCQFL